MFFINVSHHFWIISGWWCTYPSQKYESQLGSLFPNGKIKKGSKPPTRYCLNAGLSAENKTPKSQCSSPFSPIEPFSTALPAIPQS
jgi:hypothetical protein